MITKQRNRELRDLAARRLVASEPDPEAHALAVKIGAGKATKRERKRFDELMERPGTGGRSIPAFLNDEVEAERVHWHFVTMVNERLASAIDEQGWVMAATRRERDTATKRAADIRRENLVVSPSAMPPGAIGDAFRALTPDERQIVNLRLSTNAKGKRLSWQEVAEQFQRGGKQAKKYTRQRCQQIHKAAMLRQPDLVPYINAMRRRERVELATPKTPTIHEEIEQETTRGEFDEVAARSDDENNAGVRFTRNPRKPAHLTTSRR